MRRVFTAVIFFIFFSSLAFAQDSNEFTFISDILDT